MSENSPVKLNRKRFEFDLSTTGRLPVNNFKESSEYTIVVKHIPGTVSRQAIINFASQFGTLAVEPHITQISQKLQKLACLTFIEQSAVSHCMNGDRQAYTIDGHSVIVQRWLPSGLVFDRAYRVLLFLETDHSKSKLTENEIRDYFHKHYGQTKGFFWSSDAVATIDFEDYDAIDRAVLDCVTHSINGVKIRIEKVRSYTVRSAYEQIIAPHDVKFCVHVTHIPPHVSGEQLANIFDSQVWNILIRKGIHPDTDPFEAWILNIPNMPAAESLAASIDSIDQVNIQCIAESEPLNEWTLCSGNRDSWCKHGGNCIYRHVTCAAGDACIKEECPFSHTKGRKTKPNPKNRPPGPIEKQYRIRIDGVPYNMTTVELLTELKRQPLNLLKLVEIPEVPEGSKTRHLYLTRQAAEKLARKRIFDWHNYPIREHYVIKCQLEYDRASASDMPSTTLQTENQRLRSLFGPLSPGDGEIAGMPSEWIWTNRRLGKGMSNVYLVYPSNSTDDRLGAMKIYHKPNEMQGTRAKRELLALHALQNERNVVSIYQSNILDVKRKQNAPMWMITSVISEFTLEDYVEQHKSSMTFDQALIFTRQLLDIVRRCHHARVLHRNLQPKNILVKKSNDPAFPDEIKLVLIDFGLAWINNEEVSITDQEDLQMIEKYSNESSDEIFCALQHLLSSTSSEDQYRNPTIDSTGVCHILFWLLTHQWPDGMYSTDMQPHYEFKSHQKIKHKLGDAQSDTKLYDQVMLIFDRAFAATNQWWSIDELLDHLNSLAASFAEFERAQLAHLFPTTAATVLQPLNDPYARIVGLIARVKQQFVEEYSACIQWSKDGNRWSTRKKDVEVRNTDEMVYKYQERHCTVTVILFAKMDTSPATLFLGDGDQDDETAEYKFLCSLTKETTDMDVSACFDAALKKIIREKLKQANVILY